MTVSGNSLCHAFKLHTEKGEESVAREFRDQPTSAVLDQLGLAHFIEQGVRKGRYAHYSHAAESLGVSRVRVSQIVNLLSLAPTIQEAILASGGRGPLQRVTRAQWRALSREPSWERQAEQLAAWGVQLPDPNSDAQ